MNIPDLINDFLVDVREHDGFADDMHFDLIAAEVFKEKVKLVIKECVRICDEQAGAMHGRYVDAKAWNDYTNEARAISARDCAKRIGKNIRALAGDDESKPDDEVKDRLKPGGFWRA